MTLISRALRTSLNQIRHVTPVRAGAAEGVVAQVYAQAEHDFGMLAPPLALHSPAPGPLAASWAMLRETMLADGLVDRATKELVAATVSRANDCPYCVAVHSATMDGLTRGEPVANPAVRAWAQAGTSAATAATHAAPFPAEQLPELAGVAVTFQYLNRMVAIYLGDSPLPPALPAGLRGGAMRFMGGFMRSTALRPHEPGRSADLLPTAELPADLAWAKGNRHIATAFAGAAATIDGTAVPSSVRDLVSDRLVEWRGEGQGPSRAWVSDAVAGLRPADRAAGRLALLTAFAVYQIDDSIIAEFRRTESSDEALINITSWASMAAARRTGEWLVTAPVNAVDNSQKS